MLKTIISYWFPNEKYQEFWYDNSKNHEIVNMFYDFLIQEETRDIDPYTLKLSNDELLAYVILFDQLSRNIYKEIGLDLKHNDEKAFKIAQYMIENNIDLQFTFNKRIFILLPYRHTHETKNLDFVIERLTSYNYTVENSEYKLYNLFYLASLRDYAKTEDTIEVINDYSYIFPECDASIIDKNFLKLYNKKSDIWKKLGLFFQNQSEQTIALLNIYVVILLGAFVVIFLSIFVAHVIYHYLDKYVFCGFGGMLNIMLLKYIKRKTSKSFLIIPNFDFDKNNELYSNVKKYVTDHKIKRIAISLSGGVDSNVLMYILYQLRKENIIDTLVAIHVDYNNRECSKTEANYLIKVCKYMEIPIITRKIEHIKRNDTTISREFYEAETKSIRFGLYKYAMKMYDIEGVCLGHHKDDITENIFMNLTRGKNLLELYGMLPYNTIDGVNILRPMLKNHKKEIYDVAHNYRIAYFKDITPSWSFRGVMRQQIFPIMDKFDKQMLLNLNKMGNESFEWNSVVENALINPIVNGINKGVNGLSINFDKSWVGLPSIFWSKLLIKIFHSNGINMITRKNLNIFLNWINKDCENLCSLSNGFIMLKNKDKLYVVNSKLMNVPTNINKKVIINDNVDEVVENIGNWKISIKRTSKKTSRIPLLNIKNGMTFDDLLNGSYTYTEPLSVDNSLSISFSLNYKDSTNKLFRGLYQFAKIIPKCSSGIVNDKNNVNNKFVEIKLEYKIEK